MFNKAWIISCFDENVKVSQENSAQPVKKLAVAHCIPASGFSKTTKRMITMTKVKRSNKEYEPTLKFTEQQLQKIEKLRKQNHMQQTNKDQ